MGGAFSIPSIGWLNIVIYFEKCGEPVNAGCAATKGTIGNDGE